MWKAVLGPRAKLLKSARASRSCIMTGKGTAQVSSCNVHSAIDCSDSRSYSISDIPSRPILTGESQEMMAIASILLDIHS